MKVTYSRGHLLSSLVMLVIVGLAKDVVFSILDTTGIVIPVRPFVAGLVVDMHPDLRRRRDEDCWRNSRDWAWRVLVS